MPQTKQADLICIFKQMTVLNKLWCLTVYMTLQLQQCNMTLHEQHEQKRGKLKTVTTRAV